MNALAATLLLIMSLPFVAVGLIVETGKPVVFYFESVGGLCE